MSRGTAQTPLPYTQNDLPPAVRCIPKDYSGSPQLPSIHPVRQSSIQGTPESVYAAPTDGNIGVDGKDTNPERTSFVDFIRERSPDLSTCLMSQRQPSAWVVQCHRDSPNFNLTHWIELRNASDYLRWNGPREEYLYTALIIEDMDLDWGETLCRDYHDTVRPTFLAQHMLRFEQIPAAEQGLGAYLSWITSQRPNTKFSHTPDILSPHMAHEVRIEIPCQEPVHKEFHIDSKFGFADGVGLAFTRGWAYREDFFEKESAESNVLKRISARLSCCQLGRNYYLILADSAPNLDTRPCQFQAQSFEINLPAPLPLLTGTIFTRIPTVFGRSTSAASAPDSIDWVLERATGKPMGLLKLFGIDNLRSLLELQAIPLDNDHENKDEIKFLIWRLADTCWQRTVTQLESELLKLRYKTVKMASRHAFPLLTDLRRHITSVQRLVTDLTPLRNQILETKFWDAREVGNVREISVLPAVPTPDTRLPSEKMWSFDVAKVTPVTLMDYRNIADSLEAMEDRISVMARTVNEEIQMAIGSVQVEDAIAMRQQTEWMVVLAILATIYLPMTLVTGIFGMNIKETNTDATRPDRWPVVRSWGVIFGSTIGFIGLYAIGRLLGMKIWRILTMLIRTRNMFAWIYSAWSIFARWVKSWKVVGLLRRAKTKFKAWDLEAQKMD